MRFHSAPQSALASEVSPCENLIVSKYFKSITGMISICLVMLSSLTPALAQVKAGGKCTRLGETVMERGFRYTCIKAPRSASNLLGKKLIWNSGTRVGLESLRNSSDILRELNSLGYGYWTKANNNRFSGSVYVSNYPCYIYMSPSEQDMVDFWNYSVNQMFYRGRWVAIESQRWIVNDASSDGKCIEYFAFKYGGRIQVQ